jgi:hypothetical protein
MKIFLNLVIRIMVILCILACISCFGKKEPVNKTRIQNNDSVVENQLTELVIPVKESDWQLNTNFRDDHQLDEETISLIDDYIDNYSNSFGRSLFHKENIIFDGIQYIKIPGLSWCIVFATSYVTSLGLNKGAAIYLLFFYKSDDLIYDHGWEELGTCIYDINITNRAELDYDYIEDIPCRRIGNSSTIVGDFNQDGYDEIMFFNFDYKPENYFTSVFLFSILSFTDKNSLGIGFVPTFEARLFLLLPWDVITWKYGPPVQFGTYKGIEGFVIYEHIPTGSTIIDSDNITGAEYEMPEYIETWRFYTWNNEEEKYVFIDQVNPEEIKVQWSFNSPSRKQLPNLPLCDIIGG